MRFFSNINLQLCTVVYEGMFFISLQRCREAGDLGRYVGGFPDLKQLIQRGRRIKINKSIYQTILIL